MPSTRRPQRSRDNRIFAGVCGGLDASLGVSALALRIVFLIATLASGIGAIIYLLVWAVMPLAPEPEHGSFERALDKAGGHIRVGKKLIGVVSGMATLLIGASQQLNRQFPGLHQNVASDSVVQPRQYESDVVKLLEQSQPNAPQQTQTLEARPQSRPAAPVVHVSDEELLGVIQDADDAEIEAFRGGDSERLYEVYTGEALANQLEHLDTLRARNLKEYQTLLGSTVTWIKKDVQSARVRVIERWRVELHGPGGVCAMKPEQVVPQTIHVRRSGGIWKVSAIDFENVAEVEYQPC